MNTAIAEARDPIRMAVAMKHAVIAGRQAYLAGRMPKRMYADPSSPLALRETQAAARSAEGRRAPPGAQRRPRTRLSSNRDIRAGDGS
jgi:hypothetical protein